MGPVDVVWSSEEVQSCSDYIKGVYRFVNTRNNPNNKKLYAKVLYPKMNSLTVNGSQAIWHIDNYRRLNSGLVIIYLSCPHDRKSTLKFSAMDHAPATGLIMKWANSCVECVPEEVAQQFGVSGQNSSSQSIPSQQPAVIEPTTVFNLPENLHHCVSEFMDSTKESVVDILNKIKQDFVNSNAQIGDVIEKREEIALKVHHAVIKIFNANRRPVAQNSASNHVEPPISDSRNDRDSLPSASACHSSRGSQCQNNQIDLSILINFDCSFDPDDPNCFAELENGNETVIGCSDVSDIDI